jgi:hypothetical protein
MEKLLTSFDYGIAIGMRIGGQNRTKNRVLGISWAMYQKIASKDFNGHGD